MWGSSRSALLLVILLYILITLPIVTRYPAPWVDEGWIGEVSAQIAHGHPPGNPSHGTLYRYNDRIYWMPPLYFYLLGGWFSLAGVTLTAGRIFNVLVGALTTALLFQFVRRRFGAWSAIIAAIAFALDTFVWKAHRTIRFESLLALLAVLLARLLFDALDRERSSSRPALAWAGCGIAAGLLLNTHPLGALFVAAAAVEIIRAGGFSMLRRKGPWIMALVALAAILPYAIYCLSDRAAGFANFLGQNSFHVTLRDLPGPAWSREGLRYAAFFPAPWRVPAAAALVILLIAAFRYRRDPAIALCLTFIVVPAIGMIFLPNKTLLYLVPVMPFAAAIAGAIWSGSALPPHGTAQPDGEPPAGGTPQPVRVRPAAGRDIAIIFRLAAIGLVLSGVVIDAGLLWKNRDCNPVAALNEIRARLRPDDRVAGTFVTWWAAQPRPFHEFSRGATLEAIDAFRPDVIILGDPQWEQERKGRFGPLERDLNQRFEAADIPEEVVSDPCLGRVTLHRLAGNNDANR